MFAHSVFSLFSITIITSHTLQSNLPEISLEKIEHHVMYNQWSQPLCILFLQKMKNATNQLSTSKKTKKKAPPKHDKLERHVMKIMERPSFENWKFAKFYIQEHSTAQISIPPSKELLRCYMGTAASHDYDVQLTFKHWMRQLQRVYDRKLEVYWHHDIDTVFDTDLESQFFILVLPGSNFYEAIEPTLYEIRKSCQMCRILIAPPYSQSERVLGDKFSLQIYPTALMFHREKERMAPNLKKIIQGLYSFTMEKFLLHVMVLRSKAQVLSLESFESSALSTRKNQDPMVVCFYSSSNPASYKTLHAFERSVLYFKNEVKKANSVKLRFGLVDLAEAENAKIITRHLDVVSLKKIPFTAIFWTVNLESEDYSRSEINQKILRDIMPTPWIIIVALKELGIIPNDKKSGYETSFCFTNKTRDTCDAEEEPLIFFGPEFRRKLLPKKKIRQAKPLMQKIFGIPLITDKLWPQIIEKVLPMKKTILEGNSNLVQSATVKLVIFIMADCGYCEIMMPSFANLTGIAKRLYSTSVYMMNCTSDPVQCQRNGVTGYPTLALFRSLSEEESKNCLLPNSTSSSVRLDYHGNMQIDDILSWLSKAAMSAVQVNMNQEELMDMKKDVRLIAYVYTNALASKYLSRWLQQKLIPFQCFKLACEKLFGVAECFAQPSKDVISEEIWKQNVREKELVLDQVVFERRDGASTTVFKLSYPLENTIERDHDAKLHKFHRKHRYSIPSGFRCEDNHPLCTDILVKFVEDHQRLPVTHITRESFHVHGTSASIFSKEFPVLIALVHKNNISSNSSFLKELEEAAQSLYTKFVVATLNVDEFPSWAGQFVPRDYHYTHHDTFDKIPALYHYPRLCIIEWDDHQHAAFYPPVDELENSNDVRQILSNISAGNIVDFTKNYLRSKDRIILETEMF